MVAGDALQPGETATTVRVRGGETVLTDGPFAETKELLGGYYVLDVPDLLMIHHIVPIGYSAIDRRPTVRRPLAEVVHYDRYDHSKYMSNQEILGFLAELRGRTMPAYHTRPASKDA